jgi:L-aminopeptidase/D-esterase-like protein
MTDSLFNACYEGGITDIPPIRVGNAQDERGITGCTAVIVEEGAVCGVDVQGFSPGTRETELLHPLRSVEKVQGLLLAGGSAFGLDAASGVVKYLEERGSGYDARGIIVPIVPAAIIFDLRIGTGTIRPDERMGYEACVHASSGRVREGCAGAGTGATLGKIFGMQGAVKSGIGSALVALKDGVLVGALAVPNPFGDVVDPWNGTMVAGARDPDSGSMPGTVNILREGSDEIAPESGNTVLVVVATNGRFGKTETCKLAHMAQAGIARAVSPAFSIYDGDIVFVLSTGVKEANLTAVGAAAAEAVSRSIIRGVRTAVSLGGIPSLQELRSNR